MYKHDDSIGYFMKIELEKHGKYLLVQVKGRLDASWSEYFIDTLLLQTRSGRHHLVIDASEMVFLSSAGIRALLKVFKELSMVHGSFFIVEPTPFVERTLSTSGFQMWLGKGFPKDMPAADSGDREDHGENDGIQSLILDEKSTLTICEQANWHPWQAVDRSMVKEVDFLRKDYCLGIGSSEITFNDFRSRFGEFLAVAGNVVYQPPAEKGPPDYLIAEKQYVPKMHCIQALCCNGDMGRLIRFAPTERTPFYTISVLLRNILGQTGGNAAGFVMLGEIEGLVGTALIRSPGLLREDREMSFPEIRDWLTYCGERSYSHQQALLAGVVSGTGGKLLFPMPSAPDMAVHIHGAAFPYQPLENGKISLEASVGKFFNGPPPLALMHLVDDIRPVVGLGESALVRGACWFGPLQNPEVLS
jgi:anti-anti-sigma factor